MRVSDEKQHFLINPFGLLYNEISASSLVKVDAEGNVVDGGSTNFGISKSGFTLHSAIHMARKDAKCIIHVHHDAVVAVSLLNFLVLFPFLFHFIFLDLAVFSNQCPMYWV